MGAINVSSLMGAARSRGGAMWATGSSFASRRGGMMMGRAIRNTEMLSAYGRTAGMRGMAGVVGSASWKAAAIGAGIGVAGSVANDAARGNLDRGSFGRALGGGLIGGAVGGAVGAGNLMFRGNVNRVLSARAKAATAASAPMARSASGFRDFMTRKRYLNDLSGNRALGRPSGANYRAARREINAMSRGSGVAIPPAGTAGVGVPVGSARSMNMSVMGGTVVAGRPSMGRVMSGAAANRSAADAARMRAANAAGMVGMMPNVDDGMTILNRGMVNRNTLSGSRFGYTG